MIPGANWWSEICKGCLLRAGSEEFDKIHFLNEFFLVILFLIGVIWCILKGFLSSAGDV